MSDLEKMREFIARDFASYAANGQTAAYWAGMSTAMAICDYMASVTAESNRTGRGKVSNVGRAMSNIAKACGDAIENERARLTARMPESTP